MSQHAAVAEADALLEDVAVAAAPPVLDVHEVLAPSSRSVKRARRYVGRAVPILLPSLTRRMADTAG